MTDKEILATNLKMYMQLNNKTRNDVCQALGFNYYTFTDWVNAKKMPRMDKITKLAEYFGIQKSDLIEQKEPTVKDDGLSKEMNELIDCIKKLPEDKIQMLLQVARSIR